LGVVEEILTLILQQLEEIELECGCVTSTGKKRMRTLRGEGGGNLKEEKTGLVTLGSFHHAQMKNKTGKRKRGRMRTQD